jgi:CRISPR-associated protein Csm5
MKPFLHTQTCRISTLTPVHIGCGEDYYPTNYVIDGGYLHFFGELQLVEALPPAELQTLAGMAENLAGQEGLRQIQAFIHQKRQSLSPLAQHSIPVADGVARLYEDRIGRTAQREHDGRKISNQLAIQRNSFNPYGHAPYIPGSSIKGAVRTALLDALNKGNSLKFVRDRQGQERCENNQELQQRLLDYDFRHLQDDPLRLLKIGDAPYQHTDGLNGLEIRFAVNRKRRRSDKPTKADQGPPILLECLAAHRSRSFAMTLTVQEGAVRDKLPFRDFGELAARITCYTVPQFKAELRRLEELSYADRDWLASMQQLLRGELGQALQNRRAFLLRLGRFGGAESKTLNGVRRIKIMQGPGKPPKYEPESTTLWLAADSKDQQGGMLPFGWVLVEFDGTELPETHAFLRRNAQAAYDRLKREQEQRAEAARSRVEREEAAREARRRAEEDAAKARAEAQRQAALSENQKRAEALRGEMTAASKGKGPGSQLYSRLRGLIQEAPEWPEDDRRTLHDAAVAVFDWLGIKKDDGNRKKLLRSLNTP